MKEFTYSIPIEEKYIPSPYLTKNTELEHLLFFDIETTGFSAGNTTLYLIGVLFYENNNLHIIQWLNETGKNEEALIHTFADFSKNYTHLVHFNGIGFDLPYLRQKADILHIPFHLDTDMSQIDIFKEIRPYKQILNLTNMKQVSIENFLGIHREDIYSGKDLIPVYQRYVATASEEYETQLKLHNHDDLLGMTRISKILNYILFFNEIEITDIRIEKDEETNLSIHFCYSGKSLLPARILLSFENIYLNAFQTEGYLSVPLYKGTLKHFFPDYKNYYYLPLEDMAIHKNIATYVEPSNRIKATKDNCYIKKTDVFIPCPPDDINHPLFQHTPKDILKYQTLDNFYSSSFEEQKRYIQYILKKIGK